MQNKLTTIHNLNKQKILTNMTKMPVNVSSCCILALLICSRYVKFPDCISNDDFAWLYYLSIHFKMQIRVAAPHLIPYECLLSYSTGSRTSHPTCRPLPGPLSGSVSRSWSGWGWAEFSTRMAGAPPVKKKRVKSV